MIGINIDNADWYAERNFPDYPDVRTRKRLIQLNELGCQPHLSASFYIEGVFSGLYIEKVWGYSDENWNGYIEWIKQLINEAKTTNKE